MQELTPTFLLRNPTLVEPVAPWCVRLDNLSLGILLLTQPWIAGEGQRRADLERGLARLEADLPVGPVYFQRVRRAVATLEETGALVGEGGGRSRRFVITPEGFAALILNLRVLTSDPTLDGRELELKRSLVAMWNVLLERIQELAAEVAVDESWEEFFDRVESITLFDRPVVTEELMAEALDVQRLLDDQRRHVEKLREATATRLEQVSGQAELLRDADLAQMVEDRLPGTGSVLADNPEAVEMLRTVATRTLPEMGLRARVLRYDAFLRYLDELSELYARELKVVDLRRFRRRVGGRNA